MTSLSPYTRQSSTYEMEVLIREVQYRPAIWNKNYDGYMDRRLKGRMWEEICENLIPNWKKLKALQKHQISCDVQKKWRNVKDAFKKELHIERKISVGELVRKKKRYIHYDALSFLADGELCTTENAVSVNGSDDDSDNESEDQDLSTFKRKRALKERLNESDNAIKIKREHDYDDESNNEFNQQNSDSLLEVRLEKSAYLEEDASLKKKRVRHSKAQYPEAHFVGIPCNNWDIEDNSQSLHKQQYNNHQPRRREKYYDEDVSFTEMIVPILRKLNDDQKHYAKVEIMNILHKIKRYRLAMSSATQTDPEITEEKKSDTY